MFKTLTTLTGLAAGGATKVAGQLFQAERMAAQVRTRPVDHTPLVAAPADVVDIILDAARDVVAAT